MQVNYLLFETASGYSLFTVKPIDDVALSADAVQQSISDMARFSKIASLLAFKPFSTAVDALEQINSVSESDATEMLLTFLKTNLPKVKEGKKAKYALGVTDPKLANAISETASAMPFRTSVTPVAFLVGCCNAVLVAAAACSDDVMVAPCCAGIPCASGELVGELARGVRMHFSHYVKQLEEHNLRDAQRGLAHSYSRAKVKFNVNRVDNMIIQVLHARMIICVYRLG